MICLVVLATVFVHHWASPRRIRPCPLLNLGKEVRWKYADKRRIFFHGTARRVRPQSLWAVFLGVALYTTTLSLILAWRWCKVLCCHWVAYDEGGHPHDTLTREHIPAYPFLKFVKEGASNCGVSQLNEGTACTLCVILFHSLCVGIGYENETVLTMNVSLMCIVYVYRIGLDGRLKTDRAEGNRKGDMMKTLTTLQHERDALGSAFLVDLVFWQSSVSATC